MAKRKIHNQIDDESHWIHMYSLEIGIILINNLTLQFPLDNTIINNRWSMCSELFVTLCLYIFILEL